MASIALTVNNLNLRNCNMEIIKTVSDVATIVAFVAIATAPRVMRTYYAWKGDKSE